MRPESLYPLFRPVTSLSGVGPRLGTLVTRVAGPNLVDLLWTLPHGLIDWRHLSTVKGAEPGSRVMLELTIGEHQPPRVPSQPYRIRANDQTSFIDLLFFRPNKDYLDKTFPAGATLRVGGRIELYNERPKMAHPEKVMTLEEAANSSGIDVIYPLTEGLPPKVMAKAAHGAVAQAPKLPEWQNAAWLARNRWPAWHEALHSVHFPQSMAEIDPATPARQRLAYDELLASQLALAIVRGRMRALPGRAVPPAPQLRQQALAALPFTLTPAQEAALQELDTAMASGGRMLRLLQGDVGSGKTAVAFLAMTGLWALGSQTALMAPTEVLARQHAANLKIWADRAGIRMALLTGREKGEPREAILHALSTGAIQLLVGTHALISEDVAFKDLGLVIIDEQHRFGVHQRLALGAKAVRPPHVIVMTATPIPRSLALAHFGDMEMTRITGKPPGREPVETKALSLARIEDVIAAVARVVSRGERVYWVCPLVEENEAVDAAAVEMRHAALAQRFPGKVGLLHGRLKPAEKDRAIAAFKAGDIAILVATTVIEVGVDVPAATLIVIEHAERFGLAQLHQLRGRVGRGSAPSACILLYQAPLGETARARIHCLRQTDDGFQIAEEDLRLRGPGELLGQRQSGMEVFRMARLEAHSTLLAAAYDDARLIMATDPELRSARGQALRILLYLFQRDEAVRTLRAG